MPSFTSLTAGPPHKRQRCLQFNTVAELENSSQDYDHSPSPSYSLQESQSNGAPASRHRSQTVSASMSDQADELCSNANDQAASVKLPAGSQPHESLQVGSASRKVAASSAALPALAAAMGTHAPSAARSAASHAAAAAAAVTPVTSRHISSQSGTSLHTPTGICLVHSFVNCLCLVIPHDKPANIRS